ncbi:DUF977 family protein [Salmonella enterica]|uniref:DUF977 family protein n=2 Tax=Salmonella enterica TaxID=28901 RepID=UPI00298FD244|nr:DUF977 family protein [Salmonella enterica]
MIQRLWGIFLMEYVMAAPYTPEHRKKVQQCITEWVHKNGRMTTGQLQRVTGASWNTLRRCLSGLLSCGDVYLAPRLGVFTSEQAFHAWNNKRTKQAKRRRQARQRQQARQVKLARQAKSRQEILGDRMCSYDRRKNNICQECRNSEVMQRVLAFYRGNYRDAKSV